ncbi:hypothetical protein B0H19DRAFT_195502 [Mycena capillaripes]|nr:hypothetical protein B0H19DRAFT_195502 [Mycena capillaripes]
MSMEVDSGISMRCGQIYQISPLPIPLFSLNPRRNAAFNMFSTRSNDSRSPGLHGRLLHETFNLGNSIEIAFSRVRVNATLVNIHCSQISNANIQTFTLPLQSTDLSLAQPSPQNSQEKFLYPNLTDSENNGVWINVSIPTPLYWDPTAAGLNIGGYWGFNEFGGLPSVLKFNLVSVGSAYPSQQPRSSSSPGHFRENSS